MLLQCLLNWLTVWVLQICFSFVPFDLIDITCAVFFLKTLFTCQAKNHRDVGTQNIVNVCKKHDFLQKKLGTISCKSINDAHQKWDVTLEKEGHVCFWMFFTTFGNHLSNYICNDFSNISMQFCCLEWSLLPWYYTVFRSREEIPKEKGVT